MFHRLVQRFPGGAEVGARALVGLHPLEVTALLERAWSLRDPLAGGGATPFPGSGTNVFGSINAATTFAAILGGQDDPDGGDGRRVRWDHLIYAYMLENTRIYEIFRRVVHELLHGEKLGVPGEETQLWLRNTEELFFRDPPPFSLTTLSSHIRPDLRATRRNAYYRMFAMDLNHGTDDNAPYPYTRADAANNEFVVTFEELLREVWIGHINRTTTSGANPTDRAKIAEIAHKLHDMLKARRQKGNLSREELFFVAMMSWFHLTVDSGDKLPIIVDLRADASSPEQRLFRIAQMVGLPAHGLSRSYFKIAQPISSVLLAIETGALNNAAAAPAFFDPTAPNNLSDDMNEITTQWSIITGHDIKAGKVALQQGRA